jgi:prepilin-type N-terminal cleavage/methylation domain-containing protein
MAMPGTIKNRQGLTLIELLVSASIVAILTGVSFSLFMVYTREIREGVAMTRLQMQYENIAGVIASLTRNGTAVVKTSETTWPVPTTWTADSSNDIFFKNRNGTITGGLKVAGGYLQEYRPATGTWINYKAGNLNVSVTSGVKPFFLSATRNSIKMTLILRTTNVGTLYSLSSRQDEYKCRN